MSGGRGGPMKVDKLEEMEMEMLLEEIPRATTSLSFPYLPQHHQSNAGAPAGGAGATHHLSPIHYMHGDDLRDHRHVQEGWSSGSTSGNISPVGDDPLGRSSELGGRRSAAGDAWSALRHVGDENEPPTRRPLAAAATFGNDPIDPFGLGIGFDDLSMWRLLLDGEPINERRSSARGPQQHCRPGTGSYRNWEDLYDPNGFLDQYCYPGMIHDQDQHPVTSILRPSIAEANMQQQNRGGRLSDLLNTRNSHGSVVIHNRDDGTLPTSLAPRSLSPRRNMINVEDSNFEDSLIKQIKGLSLEGNRHYLQKERKRWQLDDRLHTRGSHVNLASTHGTRPHCSPSLPLKYDNLMDIEGYIYFMAKDQYGCRFLQRKFDEGEPREVDAIFNAIIDHVVELMMNPFGNYLMQKLMDVCSEEHMMRILHVLTKDPTEIVRISLNSHGTRAVQKLIETLKTRQQIMLVISALKPGFLDLIKDTNGNHVVQRCLQSFSTEDNKFIFDAAAKYCVNVATHRHGCCVLQRCIAHSTGIHRLNLVAEISLNGLLLAQDAFGNYVVQCILDLGIPSATANLASQFEGNYVHLSMQKFSSNVIEKCLKVFREEDRAKVIVELLSASRFEQLLQDPYANYVIQSALRNTKGSLYAALVEAIRPHAALLRTSPYCKRIFSRNLLKK